MHGGGGKKPDSGGGSGGHSGVKKFFLFVLVAGELEGVLLADSHGGVICMPLDAVASQSSQPLGCNCLLFSLSRIEPLVAAVAQCVIPPNSAGNPGGNDRPGACAHMLPQSSC